MEGITVPTVAAPGLDYQALTAQLRAGGPRAVEETARNFEGMFMALVLKEMRQSLEPGALFGQDGSDVYGGLFDMYMGQHLARSGILGIGDMVRRYLSHATQRPDDHAPSVPDVPRAGPAAAAPGPGLPR